MQNTYNRKGYRGLSVSVDATATKLKALIDASFPNFFAGSYREVQIQVDPEVSAGQSLRIGDGSLGTTVGGVVQKGVTLVGGSSQDTYRCSGANAIYALMFYLQSVTGTTVVNCQFFEE